MKRLKFLLFILGLVVLPHLVMAEVTDTTGPTLNSFSFKETTFYNTKSVEVDIDAEDDISGVKQVLFMFFDPDQQTMFDVNVIVRNGSGTYNSQALFREKPGHYLLSQIRVFDQKFNSTCYAAREEAVNDACPNRINEKFEIDLKDPDDYIVPHLESISFSKTNVDPGEEVTISVTTDDETVNRVLLVFGTAAGDYVTLYNTNHSKTLTGTTRLFNVPGNVYELTQVNIFNEGGAESVYNNSYAYGNENYIRDFNLSRYTITVSGNKDTIPPELKSIEIVNPNNVVYTPGFLKLKVIAVDNEPNNIKNISIVVSQNGSNHSYANAKCNGDDNGFECSMELDQYTRTGKYFIQSVSITDNSNNTTHYRINNNNSSFKPLDLLEFTVDTDTKSEVVTSTISADVIDKIKNTSNDATISIDSTRNPIVTKEVFDNIKGTERKLIIESNGIQWIFNGQTMSNDTKDVNVRVNIYQNIAQDDNSAINSVNSIVVNFAENGLLPGIAKVRIKADYALRNFIGVSDLYIYYYDEDNELLDPVAQKIDMTEDGYYEFYIEHNSKYMIANSVPNKKYISDKTDSLKINNQDVMDSVYDVKNEDVVTIDVNNANNNKDEKKNNKTLIIIICSLVGVIVVGAIAFVLIKKGSKKEEVVNTEEVKNEEVATVTEEVKEEVNEETDKTE